MDTSPEIKPVKPQFYLGMAAIMVVGFWAWWLLENYAGILLTGSSSSRSEPIEFWIPLIGTPLVLIGSIIWWRRAAGIVANGVLVEARILNFGAAKGGMRDATLHYSVEGKFYTIRKSFDKSDLGDRKAGDLIQIVADKRNPKRIILND